MQIILAPYFQMQRELDTMIYEKHNIQPDGEAFLNLLTALSVEIGECCNDWRGFKFWSVNREPKPTLLEEYVDGLHFVLSIGNLLGKEPADMKVSFPSDVNLMPTINMFALVNKFVALMHEGDVYEYLLMSFLDLGYSLGFEWPQITDAYRAKYEVNIKRQNDGY